MKSWTVLKTSWKRAGATVNWSPAAGVPWNSMVAPWKLTEPPGVYGIDASGPLASLTSHELVTPLNCRV